MIAAFQKQWRTLKRGKPGHRFRERFEASRRERSRGRFVRRVVRWILALVAVAIGVVLMFIPGPAVLFFALAGALLASESRQVARFLDWAEVKLRVVLRWAKTAWDRLPLAGKVAVVIGGAGLGAAGSYAGWRLLGG